jgi:hypothetical protein
LGFEETFGHKGLKAMNIFVESYLFEWKIKKEKFIIRGPKGVVGNIYIV